MLYKLLNKRFYKEGGSFQTSDVNYKSSVGNVDRLTDFYDWIFSASESSGLGIDFFVTVANGINVLGHVGYYQSLLNASAGTIPVVHITPSKAGETEMTISNTFFVDICNMAVSSRATFVEGADGARLWEYLYEKIRTEHFEDRPSRLQSYFAFESHQAIDYYERTHGASGVCCRLDPSECTTQFRADMRLLDDIPTSATYLSAKAAVESYWSQEMTESPIVEVLLQGKIKMLALVGKSS